MRKRCCRSVTRAVDVGYDALSLTVAMTVMGVRREKAALSCAHLQAFRSLALSYWPNTTCSNACSKRRRATNGRDRASEAIKCCFGPVADIRECLFCGGENSCLMHPHAKFLSQLQAENCHSTLDIGGGFRHAKHARNHPFDGWVGRLSAHTAEKPSCSLPTTDESRHSLCRPS